MGDPGTWKLGGHRPGEDGHEHSDDSGTRTSFDKNMVNCGTGELAEPWDTPSGIRSTLSTGNAQAA